MFIVLKPASIQHRVLKSISYKRYSYAQNIPSPFLIKFKVISFSDIQTKNSQNIRGIYNEKYYKISIKVLLLSTVLYKGDHVYWSVEHAVTNL